MGVTSFDCENDAFEKVHFSDGATSQKSILLKVNFSKISCILLRDVTLKNKNKDKYRNEDKNISKNRMKIAIEVKVKIWSK